MSDVKIVGKKLTLPIKRLAFFQTNCAPTNEFVKSVIKKFFPVSQHCSRLPDWKYKKSRGSINNKTSQPSATCVKRRIINRLVRENSTRWSFPQIICETNCLRWPIFLVLIRNMQKSKCLGYVISFCFLFVLKSNVRKLIWNPLMLLCSQQIPWVAREHFNKHREWSDRHIKIVYRSQ